MTQESIALCRSMQLTVPIHGRIERLEFRRLGERAFYFRKSLLCISVTSGTQQLAYVYWLEHQLRARKEFYMGQRDSETIPRHRLSDILHGKQLHEEENNCDSYNIFCDAPANRSSW